MLRADPCTSIPADQHCLYRLFWTGGSNYFAQGSTAINFDHPRVIHRSSDSDEGHTGLLPKSSGQKCFVSIPSDESSVCKSLGIVYKGWLLSNP